MSRDRLSSGTPAHSPLRMVRFTVFSYCLSEKVRVSIGQTEVMSGKLVGEGSVWVVTVASTVKRKVDGWLSSIEV